MRLSTGEIIMDALVQSCIETHGSKSFGYDLNYVTVCEPEEGCFEVLSSCEHERDVAMFQVEQLEQLRDGLTEIINEFRGRGQK